LTVFAWSSIAVSAQEKTITFWHSYGQPERIDVMGKIAEKFKEETGINVVYELVPWPDASQKWHTAFIAKTLPDAMVSRNTESILMYLLGASVPCDDVIESLGGPGAFMQGVIKNLYYEDHYIAITHYAHAQMLIYRKDLLEEKNIPVPRTLDEFYQAAKAVTDPANKVYGYVQILNPKDKGGVMLLDNIMRATGGRFFDKDNNIVFNSPENVKAVKFMYDLYKAASIPGAFDYIINDIFNLINSGTTAFQFDSPFVLVSANKQAPEIYKNLGVTKLSPVSDQLNINIMNGPRVKETKEFVKFLFREDNYLPFLLSIPGGQFPALLDIAKEGGPFLGSPLVQPYIEAANLVLEMLNDNEGGPTGVKYGPHPYVGILEAGIIERMLQKIYMGETDVETGVADTAKELEKLLKKQKEVLEQ